MNVTPTNNIIVLWGNKYYPHKIIFNLSFATSYKINLSARRSRVYFRMQYKQTDVNSSHVDS